MNVRSGSQYLDEAHSFGHDFYWSLCQHDSRCLAHGNVEGAIFSQRARVGGLDHCKFVIVTGAGATKKIETRHPSQGRQQTSRPG